MFFQVETGKLLMNFKIPNTKITFEHDEENKDGGEYRQHCGRNGR